MSEKIQAKKQELLDEIVAEIKSTINARMNDSFADFLCCLESLRADQIVSVFGEDLTALITEYWKLK